jgi:hypothetical protein
MRGHDGAMLRLIARDGAASCKHPHALALLARLVVVVVELI